MKEKAALEPDPNALRIEYKGKKFVCKRLQDELFDKEDEAYVIAVEFLRVLNRHPQHYYTRIHWIYYIILCLVILGVLVNFFMPLYYLAIPAALLLIFIVGITVVLISFSKFKKKIKKVISAQSKKIGHLWVIDDYFTGKRPIKRNERILARSKAIFLIQAQFNIITLNFKEQQYDPEEHALNHSQSLFLYKPNLEQSNPSISSNSRPKNGTNKQSNCIIA